MGQNEPAAQWLKRTRIAAGYTKQETLAKAIGLGRGAVGNWEVGGRPDIGNVPALAAALGVTAQEVIERFGIPSNGELAAQMPPWASEILSRFDAQTKALNDLVDELRNSRADEAAVLRGIERGLQAILPAGESSPEQPAPQSPVGVRR